MFLGGNSGEERSVPRTDSDAKLVRDYNRKLARKEDNTNKQNLKAEPSCGPGENYFIRLPIICRNHTRNYFECLSDTDIPAPSDPVPVPSAKLF